MLWFPRRQVMRAAIGRPMHRTMPPLSSLPPLLSSLSSLSLPTVVERARLAFDPLVPTVRKRHPAGGSLPGNDTTP